MFRFTRKPKHAGVVVLILKCFNNSTFFNVVCVSWLLKCWIISSCWYSYLTEIFCHKSALVAVSKQGNTPCQQKINCHVWYWLLKKCPSCSVFSWRHELCFPCETFF